MEARKVLWREKHVFIAARVLMAIPELRNKCIVMVVSVRGQDERDGRGGKWVVIQITGIIRDIVTRSGYRSIRIITETIERIIRNIRRETESYNSGVMLAPNLYKYGLGLVSAKMCQLS